jgi:hypothetical protein
MIPRPELCDVVEALAVRTGIDAGRLVYRYGEPCGFCSVGCRDEYVAR